MATPRDFFHVSFPFCFADIFENSGSWELISVFSFCWRWSSIFFMPLLVLLTSLELKCWFFIIIPNGLDALGTLHMNRRFIERRHEQNQAGLTIKDGFLFEALLRRNPRNWDLNCSIRLLLINIRAGFSPWTHNATNKESKSDEDGEDGVFDQPL